MMKLKKELGQHFLKDESICSKIVGSIPNPINNTVLLEIGPGAGALSQYLIKMPFKSYKMVEIDEDKVEFLIHKLNIPATQIIHSDILKLPVPFNENFAIIGNFPYNISSQIVFKILEWREQVEYVIGMFQKEVAKRISAPNNCRDYGILSVVLQTFYDVQYLFDVASEAFNPPPKVNSGVVYFTNNNNKYNINDYHNFVKFVKVAFSLKRKTLRNNLRTIFNVDLLSDTIFDRRAEQLTIQEFVTLFNRFYDT